ncbi:MAG: putative lipid II flippase FtsW [Candidatus Nealsonbacteria bacterium]|nr:putative lipid II flippase FtsW [Candidatus Nealsonbacteria bacterium]
MKKADYFLISAVAVLLLLGVVVITSVSAALSQEKLGSPNTFLFHHLLFGLLPGVILGFLAYKIKLSLLKKWIPALLFLNLFLLVLVFVPIIGITLGGASSWINLGITSFQPSEALKLIFILYLASWLSSRMEKTKKEFNETLLAFSAIMSLIALLLILQPDIGTLGIIMSTGLLMYFLAGTPLKHAGFIVLVALAGLTALIKLAPYRLNRFLSFINPDIDPMGISYQIKQAFIAIGSGGILGTGLGMSVQRFGFLPQPMADSIFASFAEETGFLGSLTMISFFLIFVWLGFSIAKKAKDNFLKLTALGITGWLALQTFVNIGSMVGLLPLTGVPLPFISYGGSALVTELIGIGILLNISKRQ